MIDILDIGKNDPIILMAFTVKKQQYIPRLVEVITALKRNIRYQKKYRIQIKCAKRPGE